MAPKSPRWMAPYGVLNDVRNPTIHRRVDYDDISIGTIINHLTEETFTADGLANTGPYKAIVLRVEEGIPTPGESLNWLETFFTEGSLPPVLSVKARIPELHAMLPTPTDLEDHSIIDMYPTFVAQSQDLPSPTPGNLIWVDFGNKTNFTDPIYVKEIVTKEGGIVAHGSVNPKQKHKQACVGQFLSNPPLGDPLSGQNKSLSHSGLPLLPRKPASSVSEDNTIIKGGRVSGDSAEMWQKSIETRGTPGTTWIGNIVSNGAEDSNHKSGKRDTVIFAPNTTDFAYPVELMYFFHGRAEFSNNYDFKSRFAPAIKRMSAAGRNFVLVIPELPWCHHYKKINGLTPIKSSWRGNDNFSTFHNDVIAILKESFSSKIKIGYTSITAHSQGGQALIEGLGDIIKVAPNKITLADSVGWRKGKNWAIEVWDKYVKKNTDVELNVLVSVNGWLEAGSRQAEKTMKGSNVFFDYINKGGGPTGHRKIGDLGLEWVNQVVAKQKDAAIAAAVKDAKANPVTNFDAEEPQTGATDAASNPPQQPAAKAPLPSNPVSSPSASKKKQVGKKKLPVIQQAEPFKEARVKLKDYAALDGNSNLLVKVPSTGREQKLHKLAAARLNALNRAWLADASEKGIPGAKPIKIASGWRKQIFTSKAQYEAKMIKEYGSVAEGQKWKAFQSPHMTGLAMDIGNNGLTPKRATNSQQKKTQLYTWLVENAHRFGFTPYKREAWHWEVRIPVEAFKTGKEFTDDLAVRVIDPGTSDSDLSPQAATEPMAENCVKNLGSVTAKSTGPLDSRITVPDWVRTTGNLAASDRNAFIKKLSKELEIEPEMAYAFFMVESGGRPGINPTNGKALIRFEPHVFAHPKRLVKYKVNPQRVPWAGKDSKERKEKWRALGFRHGSNFQTNKYEYEALAAAIKIDEQMAYASISTGAAQIMGFNCRGIGYKTPKAQFEAFSSSEEAQIRGFFTFVQKRAGGKLLAAIKRNDFVTAALYYNGRGKEKLYGAKIKKYYDMYKAKGLPSK